MVGELITYGGSESYRYRRKGVVSFVHVVVCVLEV